MRLDARPPSRSDKKREPFYRKLRETVMTPAVAAADATIGQET